jgi:hypothetical protein
MTLLCERTKLDMLLELNAVAQLTQLAIFVRDALCPLGAIFNSPSPIELKVGAAASLAGLPGSNGEDTAISGVSLPANTTLPLEPNTQLLDSEVEKSPAGNLD